MTTVDREILRCELCGEPWDDWHEQRRGRVAWRWIFTRHCRRPS